MRRLHHESTVIAFQSDARPCCGQRSACDPAGFGGFNGLTNLDQVSAGTDVYAGTNFDTEPANQELAVGNYNVVETVNNAIAVYSTRGKLLAGPTPINQFFKLAP